MGLTFQTLDNSNQCKIIVERDKESLWITILDGDIQRDFDSLELDDIIELRDFLSDSISRIKSKK